MSTSRFKPVLIGIFICLVLGSLMAMSLPVSQSFKGMPPSNQEQGVSGLVTRLQGNQMPMVGRSSPRTAPSPISTQVWIFSGRIKSQGTRWSITEAEKHPNLVDRIRTDAEGKFFVSLPPGEYTLFAQDGSDLYLNSFLGDGSYATVQVNEGKITETRLVNTEGATF
ncbi:MAG: hypothetical protein KME25_22105 [Symplocastrum torsivum CPER-KK1]|jgi:hypothetical protein|uniref:Carboxypeptidase regulatory-like domain-containing protein n=1 Tax=Symplocastrum torsivum CPER-KK1 TaxID=450513 RepID=A0A951UBM2_9CYAN|nr:hypothetical protein [Symplocastrum torsivum CPER-KK1]